MRAQVNSNTIANICWLIQTFKYQCCGFQVHFKSILVYDLKTKRDFWSTCTHYIMGYMMNLGSLFFLFSLGLNLTYIDYSLCRIWNVYMQYLRCCDHSNKCLFLVIQQAEVLLNFFGDCILILMCRRSISHSPVRCNFVTQHSTMECCKLGLGSSLVEFDFQSGRRRLTANIYLTCGFESEIDWCIEFVWVTSFK